MKRQSVLIIGDSYVEGVGAKKNNGWAFLLKDKMSKYLFEISGTGGDHTEKILSRFPGKEYNIYIIQTGTNDSRFRPSKNEEEIPVQKFKNNLLEIINKIHAINSNAKIMFVGLLFVKEEKTSPYKPDKYYKNVIIRKYDKIIENFANEHKIMYVSLREMLKNKESVYDGLHPSENGHIKISQLVANKLKILAKQNNKT
jgi:lysophospholipase L1-like esterase